MTDMTHLITGQLIANEGVVAVVTAPVEERLFEWAMAVAKGGIQFLGIPVTYPKVTEVTSDLGDESNLTVGVSGVMTQEHVSVALAAGAEFIITPICDPELVSSARERGLTVIAGGATPTEIARCLTAQPDLVAIHPAALLGGPLYVRFLREQFPGVDFVASGGVDVENAPNFLEAGAVATIIDRGLFPEHEDPAATEIITMRAMALTEVVAEVRGEHERLAASSVI